MRAAVITLSSKRRSRRIPTAHRKTSVAALQQVADIVDEAPKSEGVARGMRVQWTRAKKTCTGVVFWIGKANHGPGTRVGVKDDESGETVWLDETVCRPA